MNERRQILEMLSQGKITVSEAEQLLSALNAAPASPAEQAERPMPKYLRVLVDRQEGVDEDGHRRKAEQVNVRVPFQLLRAGVKLAALIPEAAQGKISEHLKEKGINFDLSKVRGADLQELMEQLADLSVDVDSDGEKVRIFCE